MVKKIFTTLLIATILVTAYGAVAFFLVQTLPPNGGTNGRLPSLYIMLGGIIGMLVGAAGRNFKMSSRG